MFKKTKDGFDLEANGHLIEVKFGPMSESDNKTVSRKEFDARPQSPDAELKATHMATGKVLFHDSRCTVTDLTNLLNNVLEAQVE